MRLLIPCYDLSTIRNSLQENLQLREIGAESGCQNVANSLYFSLLAANLGERLAPDCSLYQTSPVTPSTSCTYCWIPNCSNGSDPSVWHSRSTGRLSRAITSKPRAAKIAIHFFSPINARRQRQAINHMDESLKTTKLFCP